MQGKWIFISGLPCKFSFASNEHHILLNLQVLLLEIHPPLPPQIRESEAENNNFNTG